jgi:hypothetical protein
LNKLVGTTLAASAVAAADLLGRLTNQCTKFLKARQYPSRRPGHTDCRDQLAVPVSDAMGNPIHPDNRLTSIVPDPSPSHFLQFGSQRFGIARGCFDLNRAPVA